MKPLLTIIIAVEDNHTIEDVRKTVESALLQTSDKVSILAVGDKPVEYTKEVLSEYSEENAGKIRVIYTDEKRGAGGAFNLGIRNADTEWIAFLNEGDALSKDFAEKLLETADKTGADVVSCASNSPENDTDEAVYNETEELDDFERIAIMCANPGELESKIYKRSIFDDNGLWFPERVSFEKLGVKRLALLCANRHEHTDEKLYFFAEGEKETELQDLYDRLDVMTYFIEECYKREFLEEYPEEVEFAVIEDMYVKTLFDYINITPPRKRKITFLEMLAEAITDCFPEFETNPYYYEKYDDEIKDLIELHVTSPYKFIKQTMKITEIDVQ